MYQIKRRTKAVSSLKILAAIGLTFGLSSGALGQDCGLGDYVSVEPCLVDGDTDTVNGGCNSDPDAFSEAGTIGQTISGTVSTYVGAAPPCPHDLTGDGEVTTPDLLALFAAWGRQDPGHPADFDGDDDVDTADLLALFANWGDCDPPAGNFRDTDWYLVSHADLMAADADGNGVIVVSHIGTSEMPVVLFIVALGDPLCGSVAVIGDTGSAGTDGNVHWSANAVASRAVINIADHPNGIVYYIAPGNPDGTSINTGYPCSGVPGPSNGFDYLISLSVSELNTACTFDGEPCNVPTGNPGCNDPDCCDLVCSDYDPGCCDVGWDAFCVEFAINDGFAGCAVGIGAPVLIATGSDDSADGYLDLFVDGYGSQANFGGGTPLWIDNYNPAGGDLDIAGFTETTFLFTGAADKIVLSLHSSTISTWGGSTMTALMLDPTIVSDESGNNVDDQVINHFSVSGALDLEVIATQTVETFIAEGGAPVATWRLSYEITNDSGAEATFEVVRWLDLDLFWNGDWNNDVVGTGTNAGGCDHYVYQGEAGSPATSITLSTDHAGASYVGSKNTYDLDCAGPAPQFGFGTDPGQYWAAAYNGLPVGWADGIAGVGSGVDGDSGTAPADGCPEGGTGVDASIGLFVTVTLAAGATDTVTFIHTYGAITPNGVACSK